MIKILWFGFIKAQWFQDCVALLFKILWSHISRPCLRSWMRAATSVSGVLAMRRASLGSSDQCFLLWDLPVTIRTKTVSFNTTPLRDVVTTRETEAWEEDEVPDPRSQLLNGGGVRIWIKAIRLYNPCSWSLHSLHQAPEILGPPESTFLYLTFSDTIILRIWY